MKLTKRLLSMLLVLCMVFSVLPAMGLPASAATVSGTFTKVASLADVTSGQYVIIGTQTASSYGRLTYGNLNSKRIPYTKEYTSVSDLPASIQDPDGLSVWTLEVSGTSVTIYNAEKGQYLNTGFAYATSNPTIYTLAYNADGYFTLANGTNYIGVNKESNYWRTYGTTNLINNGGLYLYKLSGGTTTTKYTVTLDDTLTGGTIIADKTEAAEGETVTLTATPADGYLFSDWHVTTDETNTKVTVTNNQFTMPAEDVTVSAEFAAKTAATLTYSENGTTHNASGTYYVGDSVTLEDAVYEAAANYTFMGWLPSAYTDGTEPDGLLKAGDSYTLSAADNTLYAVYAIAGEGGESSDEFTITTSLTTGKYVFGAVKASASATLSNATTFGAIGFTNTYNDKSNNWGKPISDMTPDADGKITVTNADYIWELVSVSESGNRTFCTFKKGDSYLYLGTLAGSTSNGAQAGLHTEASVYVEKVSATCKDAFLLHPTATSTNILLYNTSSSGYRMYAPRDYNATMTPYIRFYKADAGTTYTGWTTSPDTTPVTKYTITVAPTEGGKVAADKIEAAAGATVTLTITPNEGYKLKALTVKGADNSVIAVTDNTFTMPGQNVTVTATFEKLPTYTVTFYLKDGASAAKSVEVTEGSVLADGDYPTVTAVEGFAFLGWYNGSYASAAAPAFFDKNTPITENIDLYAVYGEENETSYTLVTDLSQLYDGQKIVVYNPANTVALSSADAAKANYRAGVAVLPADGVLTVTEADDAIVWTLGKNGGQYSFTKNGSFLTMGTETSGSRSLTLGDSVDYWTLASSSAANAYLVNSVSNSGAALEYYSGKWCGYTKADSTAFQTQFFVPQIIEYTTNPVVVPSHTVTWYNGDAVFQTTEVKEGKQIVKPDGTPTRVDDGETYYSFGGWADKDGNAITEFPLMGSEDMAYYAVFTPGTYAFTAQITGKDSIRAGKSANLTATLSSTPAKDDYSAYTATWSSSAPGIATADENGLVTGVALGEAVITVIYKNADDVEIATATKTITVVESTSTGGYTLITQDMEDWSGDYIIMGKPGGDTTYMNTWMILTPDYDSGTVEIATNNEDAATITLNNDSSGTGIINDEGNLSSGVDKKIVMEDTGLVTDTSGNDIDVYDTITEIDDAYAFTIDCIDDINQIYTICVKDSNLYIACAPSGKENSLNFSASATEYAQWKFSVERVTKGGYNNDIITAQNVGNKDRRLYFNSNGYGNTDGQFRDYRTIAYSDMIGGDASGQGQTYNLYLFGNPNPFKAQIYYQGDQITLVNTAKVPQGKTEIDLSSALVPNIDEYPNWTKVGEPTWSIMEQSSDASMSIDHNTGAISTNGAASGSYALVTVTYVIRNEQTQATTNVSTTAKVEITNSDATYSTIIYETASGYETEVQYTVTTGVTSLPLKAYVVNDLTGNNSKTGTTVMGGTITWTVETVLNGSVVSIDTNGVLDLLQVTKDETILIKASGATGDGVSASEATYKVYVKYVAPTLTADSLVIDFSLPVKFDPRANDTGHGEETVTGIGTTTTVGSATSITIEGAGTATLDGNEITFTPTAILSKPVIFYYYIGDLVGMIRVIPATNVYYEDSTGGDVFTFTPETAWTTAGETINNALQNADFVGAENNNVYGYDAAYDAFAQYSMGSAHIATVGETTNKATVQFSFYGTGFDVISLTGGNSGCLLVDVYSGTATEGTDVKPVKAYFVDTYYGYDSDGNVISDSPNFYQIPVMKIDGLEYGQYTAVITAYYHPLLNHAKDDKDDSYQFVFDAVRIYDPCGSNATANEAYQSDGEANAHYISLRDALAAGVEPEPTTYTATFVVPEGVTAPAEQTGVTTATMPTADVPGLKYTFVGWVGQQVDNADTKPENVYAPDSEVPLTADTTFYALYSYTKTTGGGGDWTLVTDASTLKAGDQLLIASNQKGYVAGDISSQNMAIVEATFASDNSTVTKPAGAVVLTLGGSNGAWTLANADGQLLGATAVKKLAWDSGTTAWKITISDNDATIQSGTSTYGRFLFNANSGQERFTTYTSDTSTSMLLPQLYRQSGSGTATICYTTVISNSTVVTYTINLAADTTSIAVGGKANLTATLYADGVEVADAVPTWRNTQDSVATIVQNANLCTVTGVADGTTQVYATFTCPDGSTKEGCVTITVSSTSTGDQPASYSKTSNSGTRGVTCTTLDGTYADSYYVGSYTYANLSSQTGSTLLNSLRTLMTDSHTHNTTYSDCRDKAYLTDCQQNDEKVTLLYTGVEATMADYEGNVASGVTACWNREHVWPKSLGNNQTEGAGADLHHVRPDDKLTNSARDSYRYGNVSNGTEATGSALVNGMSGGRYGGDYFEPLDNVKGDVARICLYLYVRYGGTITQYNDITNVFEDVDVLLEWCELDPVDTWEMGRNVVVANIQGNRNVFIDYPELAWLIFDKQVPGGMTTPSGNAASTASTDSTASVAAAAVPYEFTAKAAGTPVNSNVVFIDGNGEATLEEYLKNGPANEVYLAPGQAIAFNVSFEAAPASIQLGMKTIAGGTANVNVTCGGSKDFSIATATEMYYDITDCITLNNNTTTAPIVITNNSDVDVLLSVTNLKWTTADSTAAGAKTAVFMTPESAQEALRVVDSVLGNTSEPEEPIDPADPIDPDEPDVPVEPAVKPEQFKDLDKNAWYYDGVVYAIENGLMNGVALDAFAPDGTLTRAMLVTVLYRQAGSPAVEKNAEIPFTDVARGLWYTDAIIWANQEGIALGNSATTFAPDDPVTREQMVTFLWRFAGEKDSGQTLASFADANTVADYAELPMKWAVENGIINGDNGKLLPQDTATRAQIANIFMRYENSLALSE